MRIANLSQVFFAVTLAAIGLLGLVKGGYGPIWDGVPKGLPAREALGYVCALAALASGLGFFWRRTAAPAARLLFAYLFLWMLLVKGRFIVLAPTTEVSYESWGESAVLMAAAWVIYADRAGAWDQARFGFATGAKGLQLARVIYGLALIAFGLSHYAYANDTASLVPAWLPMHPFWVYLTGSAYVAAGGAVLFGLYARLAAALAAAQMAGFTLLVWAPYVATGHPDAGQWSEFVLSWALTAGGWVVAESYRGLHWLAAGKH